MISENTEIYNVMIEKIANLTHEKFRKIYQEVNNGTRVKITKDEAWIKQYSTDQADLAKLNYFGLPSDWQKERWFGAKMALDVLLETVKSGKLLNEEFIERASDMVHQEWLDRNFNRAENEHKLSYKELSEEAKEKDRIFVRSAIEIFETK